MNIDYLLDLPVLILLNLNIIKPSKYLDKNKLKLIKGNLI